MHIVNTLLILQANNEADWLYELLKELLVVIFITKFFAYTNLFLKMVMYAQYTKERIQPAESIFTRIKYSMGMVVNVMSCDIV